MKKTKTWKLGEWAEGGIITVEVRGKIVVIIGKEWDFSKGSTKSSDQSNAKEFTRGTILSTDSGSYLKIINYLCGLTTSYYADQIIKWIESKVALNKEDTFWV